MTLMWLINIQVLVFYRILIDIWQDESEKHFVVGRMFFFIVIKMMRKFSSTKAFYFYDIHRERKMHVLLLRWLIYFDYFKINCNGWYLITFLIQIVHEQWTWNFSLCISYKLLFLLLTENSISYFRLICFMDNSIIFDHRFALCLTVDK